MNRDTIIEKTADLLQQNLPVEYMVNANAYLQYSHMFEEYVYTGIDSKGFGLSPLYEKKTSLVEILITKKINDKTVPLLAIRDAVPLFAQI
jgi:hypothetical protein